MSITIGRSSKCDIIVPDSYVSAVHAEISRVNGQYVYRDRSSNGSTINGQLIHNTAIAVAPGANILMANRVPLPWDRIYQQLPLQGVPAYDSGGQTRMQYSTQGAYQQAPASETPVGWCILSFLIPILGWILYFAWRSDNPAKAEAVCTWAWIGFAVNILISILYAL